MNEREDKCVNRIDECQVDKPEEEPIVPSPNAGANPETNSASRHMMINSTQNTPWTVMVKLLDTVVTHGAVLRSWRTIDEAGAYHRGSALGKALQQAHLRHHFIITPSSTLTDFGGTEHSTYKGRSREERST